MVWIEGKAEQVVSGTKLEDFRASYPTCYLVEKSFGEVNARKAFRASNYVLEAGKHYVLEKGEILKKIFAPFACFLACSLFRYLLAPIQIVHSNE